MIFLFGWWFLILCMVYNFFFFLLKSHFNSMLKMWDWTLAVTQICACYISAEDNAISRNNLKKWSKASEFTGIPKLNGERSYSCIPIGFLATGVCLISLMCLSHSPTINIYSHVCSWPIFILTSVFDSAVE